MSRIDAAAPAVIVQDSFWLLLAALLLLDANGVLLLFLCAAAAHEAGHYLVLRLCGGRFLCLQLSAAGAVMRYRAADRPAKRLCIAAAGPAASFAAAALAAGAQAYAFAGANVLLGLFNLLPVAPLDGGTMLACALSPLGAAGGRLCRAVSVAAAVALAAAGAALAAAGYGVGVLGMGCLLLLQQKNLQKRAKGDTMKTYSGKIA